MAGVVPEEELLAVSAGIFNISETLGEVGAVFQRLELRFQDGIVIRAIGVAGGLADLEIHSNCAMTLNDMGVPRSACSVSVPGAIPSLARVSAINCSVSSALSPGAIIQPTP